MKKGFWNYTEPITYRVLLVRLMAVATPAAHWANKHAGEERQVVEIRHDGYTFYIDNQDGSGLKKIEERGTLGSYSAHLSEKGFVIIKELPEAEWLPWDAEKHQAEQVAHDAWVKEHHPDIWKKTEALKKAWENSPVKKMLDDQRK